MVGINFCIRACIAAGVSCLAFFISTTVEASNLCPRGWHARAEMTADLGVSLLHSGRAADRIRLWRSIELGEESPVSSRGLDGSGEWRGTWREEQEASGFLAQEAAKRGINWSLRPRSYGRSDINVWFAAKLF